VLKTHSKSMVVYHWWCDNPNVAPYQDLCSPVVLSIAVLRAHNRTIPITVLDLSQRDEREWGCFPELLNFEVVKWTPLLDLNLYKSSRLCSRVWDVWDYAHRIPENNILFTDSDIFWLKNPFPLNEQDKCGCLSKFYCSSNTGVWYFDKTSQISEEVIRVWKFIISRVLIRDMDFYTELCVKVTSLLEQNFQDEIAFGYLIVQHPELYNPVGSEENFAIYRLMNKKDLENLDNVKCLHALGAVLGCRKGRICLVLRELKDAIEKVLNKDQIEMIFGNANCDVHDMKEIKNLTRQELKQLLEFTGNNRSQEILKELNV
jgi:hypothetical protein